MEEQERQNSQEGQPSLSRHFTKAWRARVSHALPCYTSPYSVNYLEAELPVDELQESSRIKRGSRPALHLDTVLFSAYYPTDPVQQLGARGYLGYHGRACKGYAEFFSIPNFPVTTYIACTCIFTKLPALRNSKLAGAPPSSAGTAVPKK